MKENIFCNAQVQSASGAPISDASAAEVNMAGLVGNPDEQQNLEFNPASIELHIFRTACA
jgi:hypothetical protein